MAEPESPKLPSRPTSNSPVARALAAPSSAATSHSLLCLQPDLASSPPPARAQAPPPPLALLRAISSPSAPAPAATSSSPARAQALLPPLAIDLLPATLPRKCIAAIRILAYGLPANAVDEYVRIGPSTAQEALKHFCRAVIDAFGGYYLRAPTEEDVRHLVEEGEQRGFPGMLGSIDCMHWTWRNCPSSWKGMFTGRGKSPSMILEAVASRNLWIWHAYFGMPGSCNDINVLHRSSLFDRFMQGTSTPVNFTVNGHSYNMGYYLADGIYPDWPTFVKTVRHPMEMKTRLFAAK
ncbi:uncharacterized protein LOC112895383 [Panicum hallii]|uniref:uncharacterized protein LOC112895383 n=1 Tax=Panicum hallii TaxID=206008 RepID=UPI000DF4D746|nr:uncharacterized protein LOC112895383 [Panicum hallii]